MSEINQLRAELADVRAAKSDNLIKAVENLTKFSDLLQDCLVLFTEIAHQDDSGAFEINNHLRTQLDAMCVRIKAET
ncbi:hypothetical protein UFOVP930_56 [uncultured Caudovirales phage]|uniref:Uncharacterized protein n=1 Tax=uncultured Caudovirales phage TaxID=2100421 RepID=A0A6J7XP76_9CAUD|nr:hypothetical protein UFOVP930_56 [uncultured Caudovirales phage]CAB4199827.1 hypothetical protein UFOVP1354_10 [uncultured Caudovirales phage]CAB5238551.1 hypothetical protein UFOVP1547_45 [uncultured Caudovirales phage]